MGRPLNSRNFNPVPAGSVGDTVASITVTAGGSYSSIPTVSLTTPPDLPGGIAATLGSVHMGLNNSTVSTSGTGDTTRDYAPGDILTLVGGTSSTAAKLQVASVKVRTAAIASQAGGFANGDTVTFSSGWTVPAVLTLTVVGGVITAITITNAGSRTTALPADPVTPTATSGGGTLAGTTFNLGFGVNAISVNTVGNYTALPGNPVSTTTNSAHGTGATLTVNWQVIGVDVATGGSGYVTPPTVAFGSGAAAASSVLGNIGSTVILAHARIPGSANVLDADIVKQISSTEYLMNTTDGSGTCGLVSQSALIPGQAYVKATDSLGSTYFVTKIQGHLVGLVRWTNGGSGFVYPDGAEAPWGFDTASNITVQLESV